MQFARIYIFNLNLKGENKTFYIYLSAIIKYTYIRYFFPFTLKCFFFINIFAIPFYVNCFNNFKNQEIAC